VSNIISASKCLKKNIVIGKLVAREFKITFDARIYLFSENYSTTEYLAYLGAESDACSSLKPAKFPVSPIDPGEMAEPFSGFGEGDLSWLLDQEACGRFCKDKKINLTLYFIPKSRHFKRRSQKRKCHDSCAAFDFIRGDPESGESLKVVVQAWQVSLEAPPVVRAWRLKEEKAAEISEISNRPSFLSPGPEEGLMRRKRLDNLLSDRKARGSYPLKFCCTNDKCKFCPAKISQIMEEKKIWFKKSGTNLKSPFSPVPVSRDLELLHRLRTTCLHLHFRDAERAVMRAKNLSLVCFDVEAITVRKMKAMKSSVSRTGAPSSGGLRRVGSQLPVMIGVSYLKQNFGEAVTIPDIGTKVFEIAQHSGDISEEKVSAMVEAWLGFLFALRKSREELKREILRPVIDELTALSKEAERVCAEKYNMKNVYSFDSTFFGTMLQQLDFLCRSCYLVSFMGSRYDLGILDKYIYAGSTAKSGRKIKLARNGRTYKIFRINDLVHVDLRDLMGGGSLSKISRVLGVDKKYKISKTFQPFKLFTSLDFLASSDLPDYGHDCFTSMNSEKKICSEEEYLSYKKSLRNFSHRELLCAYLKQDVLVTMLSFLEAQTAYRDLFGIEVIGGKATTSSGLFFREATVIQPFLNFQPSFVKLATDSTVFFLTMQAISGGLVCKSCDQISLGDRLYPDPETKEEESKICEKILTMDFRSLYPSQMINNSKNCIGEPVCYSPTTSNETNGMESEFKISSGTDMYSSQHYVMCCLELARLLTEGFEPYAVHHCAIAGEISLIPRNYLDFVAFGVRAGKRTLHVYQYDGSVHALPDFAHPSPLLHVPGCEKAEAGRNDTLLESDSYKDLLAHGEWQESAIRALYSRFFDEITYRRDPPCSFHSEYVLGGKKFPSPREALREAAALFPSLNIVFQNFPRQLTPSKLLSKIRDGGESSSKAGLICLTGHFDRGSRFFDKRFGLCIGKRKIEARDLTEEFYANLEKRLRLENPGDGPEKIAKKLDRFVEVLLGEERLLPSHSVKAGVVSLAYWEFLCSVGFKTTDVHHIVLYPFR